jgi:hypothetical protein
MNFADAADELHRQEFSRLAGALTPTLEQLRSMTATALRDEIARMWDGLGHTVITTPDAGELVTIKGERKFITMCVNPALPVLTPTPPLCRLRDRVVAAGAERGFFVSVRGFTHQARQFAEAAPVQLIDGPDLIRAMHRSRKGMLLPQTYKAMCRHCGDIVQHRLSSDEAQRCANGHFVAPTIARAELIRPRAQPGSVQNTTSAAPRPYSRQEVRAHNYRYAARMGQKARPH